jgi:hypothetical protein
MKTAMLGETRSIRFRPLYILHRRVCKYLSCKILHRNQEQIRHKRPHRRNAQYVLRNKKQNHGDIPKKISKNKLKTNSIIVNSFHNIIV